MPASKAKQTGSKGRTQQRGKSETTFIDLLLQDHEKVRDLFEQIEEDEEGENREELFPELESELQMHMELEEKFFYPVLQQAEDAREKALEAYEEHNVAKTVLGELEKLKMDDERWQAKMNVLHEIVNHHLEEEEKNTFKMAKKILEKDQIQEITQQIQEQKTEKKAA